MPKLLAVVEAAGASESQDTPWPVAKDVLNGLVPLSGASLDAEIGAVVWQLIVYNQLSRIEPLRGAVAAKSLVLPGGLVVEADRDRVIRPGCCAGLENWREWLAVPSEGGSPWMGHDPDPWIENIEGGLRIWSDGAMSEARSRFSIDVGRDELGFALRRVEQDLKGFLERLETWAEAQDSRGAAAFAQRFDQMFEITRSGSRPRGA